MPDPARLDIRIPIILRRRLKSVAAASGRSMGEVVADLVSTLPPTQEEDPERVIATGEQNGNQH